MTDAWHRRRPHTADRGFEVWAPTRDECYAEAVRALVGSFAEVDGRPPAYEVRVDLGPAAAEDLLAHLLDEVLERVTGGEVPVDVAVADTDEGGLLAEMIVASTRDVRIFGDVPVRVSADALWVHPEFGHWTCKFLVET